MIYMHSGNKANELEGILHRKVDDSKIKKIYSIGSFSSLLVGTGSLIATNYTGSDSQVYLPLMLGAAGGISSSVLLGFGALYHHANDILQRIGLDFYIDESSNEIKSFSENSYANSDKHYPLNNENF